MEWNTENKEWNMTNKVTKPNPNLIYTSNPSMEYFEILFHFIPFQKLLIKISLKLVLDELYLILCDWIYQ